MKRRLAVAAVLAAVASTATAPAALAGSSEWCDLDPVVLIKTPRGNLVPVFNTMGVRGLKHQAAMLVAKVNYSVQPAEGGRKTRVKLDVTVPEGPLWGRNFDTRTVISTGPLGTLKVLGRGEGRSGRAMRVQFTLDRP
jgi:hypothetical protein